MEEKLYAGVGKQDITPPVGGRLFGYRPDVFSKSVSDGLTATALAVARGATKILIVSVTVCLFKTELAEEIRNLINRETSIPAANIIICATHTHSGPNTCGMTGWGDIDREYCDNLLIPRIIEAAKSAANDLKPAIAGVNSVFSKTGINRRQLNADGSVWLGQNPWGIYDPNMTAISFRDSNGAAIASIVHYGAHCTAAGMNRELPEIGRELRRTGWKRKTARLFWFLTARRATWARDYQTGVQPQIFHIYMKPAELPR